MPGEAVARGEIDRKLVAAGWTVQDHKSMNLSASFGVAVREFPLRTGFADYLQHRDGQVVAVVEAKPIGSALTGVELKSSKYMGLDYQRDCRSIESPFVLPTKRPAK